MFQLVTKNRSQELRVRLEILFTNRKVLDKRLFHERFSHEEPQT